MITTACLVAITAGTFATYASSRSPYTLAIGALGIVVVLVIGGGA